MGQHELEVQSREVEEQQAEVLHYYDGQGPMLQNFIAVNDGT